MADLNETPKEFAEITPPRDLYATSDIRFVMLEIGKLTSSVDRLISDVKSHGDKIDQVRHQVTFVKGGLYVLAPVVAFISYLFAKWDVLTLLLNAIRK
ncbi:hypothetical protein DR64_3447 [Paraburkholderia xenovorans LB400]|uniref:Transmembrane protein n=1 Tax=Paraburkholderia xenovorans (strain LB400) TaxID=266265 RepID=Q13W72_PARXL|nr:hypothetical protein [Paraburkholderia xenovorans]ABE31667.1 hypothetical protein Bxe_A1286 [Paraburkholderia xenovorans LB400]AIP31436.1 hypothetical protein DR64_3447 [Paraburkholderia xenovorans LB400]